MPFRDFDRWGFTHLWWAGGRRFRDLGVSVGQALGSVPDEVGAVDLSPGTYWTDPGGAPPWERVTSTPTLGTLPVMGDRRVFDLTTGTLAGTLPGTGYTSDEVWLAAVVSFASIDGTARTAFGFAPGDAAADDQGDYLAQETWSPYLGRPGNGRFRVHPPTGDPWTADVGTTYTTHYGTSAPVLWMVRLKGDTADARAAWYVDGTAVIADGTTTGPATLPLSVICAGGMYDCPELGSLNNQQPMYSPLFGLIVGTDPTALRWWPRFASWANRTYGTRWDRR